MIIESPFNSPPPVDHVAAADPSDGSVTTSTKNKNTTFTARFTAVADQAKASVMVTVSGIVPTDPVCGSQLPISGSRSASAVAGDGTTVRSPYTGQATITVTRS